MNPQLLVPYVPFLALLYALFALLQALRHKRQGIVATLLALVSIAAPVIAYLLSSSVSTRASLAQTMLINAAIVFVASLVTLLIERRNRNRDANRSYGMLGLGVSMILVVALFALPLLATSSASATVPAFTSATHNGTSGNTVLVSDVSQNAAAAAVQPEATQSVDSTPSNTRTGNAPTGNSGAPSNTSGANTTKTQATVEAQATEIPATATEVATQVTPTEALIQPTRIVFPTSTPTPDTTEEATEEATASSPAASNAATCTLVVDYNLNLRTQPTTDGSTVLLSIPYGTTVTTDGKTSDGWYQVTYEGKTGWVSGTYVTASSSCSALATVKAS